MSKKAKIIIFGVIIPAVSIYMLGCIFFMFIPFGDSNRFDKPYTKGDAMWVGDKYEAKLDIVEKNDYEQIGYININGTIRKTCFHFKANSNNVKICEIKEDGSRCFDNPLMMAECLYSDNSFAMKIVEILNEECDVFLNQIIYFEKEIPNTSTTPIS
ncbi:MAG: hypothetical protein IJF54_02675 [Clostridia bacterium]|nr:hypothetical protein [Clostridia bacterium]